MIPFYSRYKCLFTGFDMTYPLVNTGPLSLTSVIMTNSSEVTEKVPSVALMRRVTSLLFSRSRIPTTVIFPDEGSIENFAAYSLVSKEYVMMELLP